MRSFVVFRLVLPLLPLAFACTSVDDTADAEDELTSLSARSRELTFEGYVYVRDGASEEEILSTVRSQTQTAFGALRTSEVSVKSRELKEIDPKTFAKSPVLAIDTDQPNDTGTKMTKVRYRYTDAAIVPTSMASRSMLPSAVMSPNYRSQASRILVECTDNDEHAREFQGSIWYVFNPSVSPCATAMKKEQDKITADTAKLKDIKTQVSKSEVERLYLPTTLKLGADKTNKGKSFPEYDRLFAGGVSRGKLVVSMVSGFIGHGGTLDETDSGFEEWIEQLHESMGSRQGWKVVKTDPAVDLGSYDLGGTKKVSGLTFNDISAVFLNSQAPKGVSSSDVAALKKAMGAKLIKNWITLETTVPIAIGGKAAEPVALQILTYFGASSDSAPHKFAIKNSDVFIYNGHSYIGFGPLDPKNFTAADFPSSYQLFFVDGCVSYNYYNKDYVPLKKGGTKNLDLITNGLEANSWKSGWALGQFVQLLLDGKQHSYLELLKAAEATDSLRVVDGELDNVYNPSKTPIVFK